MGIIIKMDYFKPHQRNDDRRRAELQFLNDRFQHPTTWNAHPSLHPLNIQTETVKKTDAVICQLKRQQRTLELELAEMSKKVETFTKKNSILSQQLADVQTQLKQENVSFKNYKIIKEEEIRCLNETLKIQLDESKQDDFVMIEA